MSTFLLSAPSETKFRVFDWALSFFSHRTLMIAPIRTRTRIVSLESGALPACLFPAGTLIVCRAVYLFVHCAHFIALSNPFHYNRFYLHVLTTNYTATVRVHWYS